MSIPRYHFQALATNTTKLMLTMTSLLAPSDILSLRFEAGEPENNKRFQRNRQRHNDVSRILITTFEAERSMTLFCNGLTGGKLNLLEALRSELLELVESGKDNAIMVPHTASPQMSWLKMPPKPWSAHVQKLTGIYTNTTHTAWKVLQAV
ncbi:hypothetical protein DDE83_008252 [Stemphylium lycopersici]|uniref:Uncharacterized protein n=1 Tax=Stemphylium lycopersici TaxID=183478 RepID=A0A364MTU7_STELY|nr:hypothetical protein DDE83_008252 [Stemphylium lycopersici]